MREKMQPTRRDRHRTICAAVAETLEPRRLLAGIEAGILVGRGGFEGDTIEVRRSGGDDVVVTTNGVSQTFDMDDFTGVLLDGGGGNDRITLVDPLTSPLVRPVTLEGGDGNDTLIGNAGNESLAGGSGDDVLDGKGGTDTLNGGIGEDTLLNGEVTPPPGKIRILDGVLTADGAWGGEDIRVRRVGIDDVSVSIDSLVRTFDMDDFTGILLRGNNGYDFIDVVGNIVAGSLTQLVTLEGGNGIDTLFGEGGADVLRGGAGADVLFGEGGNDSLFGEAGDDTDISGGPGNDFIHGGDGDDSYLESQDGEVDTVVGGPGNDFGAVDAIDQRSEIEGEDVAVEET